MSDDDDARPDRRAERGLSRRSLFGLAGGALVAGAAGGVGVGRATVGGRDEQLPSADSSFGVVDFYGRHQAGIGTPAQDRLHFAALDIGDGATRADLIDLMKTWTAAAVAMTAGEPIGGPEGNSRLEVAPLDTGEAFGLDPAKLTITIGFGPSLFNSRGGGDRFRLAARRPRALVELPHFGGDELDPQRSGGDIALQACSDDPQVAVHAIRNLVRIGHGISSVRYSQIGFGRTSSTTSSQVTPRNLFGFKDGTANIRSDNADLMRDHVWVGRGDERGERAWIVGGSYLVTRRIRMHIETWDRDTLDDQEIVIGRQKLSGAPFRSSDEFAALDFERRGEDGEPLVDQKAHVRLAHPTTNDGIRLLRRGYSFVDGSDAIGRLEAGLFFISYQRDPARFAAVQRRLAGKHGDLLNEYIVHVGGGLWAIPPGVRDSRDWWGRTLLES